MAVDGSLKFDTKIDTNGFNRGVNGIKQSCGSMMNSFKKLGAAVGIAFGIGAIIQFSKASIQASNDIENAMMGLKSIIEGQGRDFSKAKEFIQEYTEDGLIYAADAITSYKNLLARGYNDDQIQKVLLAFKNSSTYGRQAALEQGEAVKSATEGLKNENSILVDNAGVTKNVSMMWEDYAKSIGVSVGSLTKQQKIQAEVLGIMEETRFQTGDAAKVADTYSGSILKLQFNLNNMKIAFGNFIKPIISSVIPVINQAVLAFTRFFNVMAQVSTLLFGKQVFASDQAQKQESALGGAAENEKDLAKAAEKANKASKNQLASFDEINVLAKETVDNIGGDTPTVPTGGGTGDEIGGNVEVSPEIAQAVERIRELLEPLSKINLDNLSASFGNLKKAIAPFTKSLFSGLEWAYQNIFMPLSKFMIEDVLPRYLDILAIAADGAGFIFDKWIDVFEQFYTEFLKPLADFAAPLFLTFLDDFKVKLEELFKMIKSSDAFEDFKEILSKIYSYLVPMYEKLILIAAWFADFVMGAVFLDLEYKFKDLEDAIGLVSDLLNGDFSGAWEHFKDLMIDNKIDKVKEQLALLKEKFTELKEYIISFVDEWSTQITAMFDEWKIKIETWWTENVTPWFTLKKWKELFFNIGKALGVAWTDFVNFWTIVVPKWLKDDVIPWFTVEKWAGIFKNIITSQSKFWGDFSSSWGAAISDWWENDVMPWFTVEKWVELGKNIIIGIIEGFKSAMNFFKEIFSSFEGGFNIGYDVENSRTDRNVRSYSLPPVPHLATGAVIPPNREFMAVLGDQRNGTNIETPLDTMVQAFKMASANSGSNEIVIKFTGALSELVRILKPELDNESNRKGTRLVIG